MTSDRARGWTLAAALTASVILIALLASVHERKREESALLLAVAPFSAETDDPGVWGERFPLQYETYLRSVDSVRTRHGGSEAIARAPTAADPRSVVAQSKLDEDPRLRLLYAGYPFALDYREERGHAYMLEDQSYTLRLARSSGPGACLQCHASTYGAMMRLGEGDLTKGFERLSELPWPEARARVEHPVACIDCHDPRTLALRITRPAFAEGLRAWKRSEGIADYDVLTEPTNRELRSFVCAQCHVEYFFAGPEKRLTLPWSKGLSAEAILADYEERGHRDWLHAETGTPLLKAQHPEFELFSQGSHARAGVACADCHMPYRRDGARKFSDHQVRSPLLDVNRACQACHRDAEPELLARVEAIQERTYAQRERALSAIVDLIDDLRRARAAGRSDVELALARDFHRRAQFLADFVEAENSLGFHAPQEAALILGTAIDYARQGQIALQPNDESDR